MDGARAAHGDLPWRLYGSGGGIFAESRDQDAGTARSQTMRKRDGGREILGEACESGARFLPWLAFASRSQIGEKTNARIRLHARVRSERRLAGGAARLRPRAIIFAGGEPRRRGVAGGFAGVYFALQHERRRVGARRRDSGDGARVHRHRGRRGSHRRFAAGARLVLSFQISNQKRPRKSAAATKPSLRLRGDWRRGGVFLFYREHGLHDVFELVGALHVFGIIVDASLEGAAVLGADALQLFLQTDGDALGVERIGFRENQAEKIGSEVIDGIGGAKLAGHGFGGVAESGGIVAGGGGGADFGADEQQSEIFLHGHGAAILHGEAIPEMVDVRHGLEQVGAGLQAQLDIALKLFQNLLLELADGALAFEQVTDEEKGERAEAKKGDAESPLVGDVWVDKDERVHEDGQAAGQHKDEDGGHDGELKFAAFETFEFLPIDGCHSCFHLAN